MTRSTCSAVAEQGKRRGSNWKTRVCICLTVLLVFAAVSASAQTTATPPTTTIQILGNSAVTAPSNPPTAPVGGIILYGSQISPITNQPVRHLWVGDSNFGMCRIDPDLDTPITAGVPSPFNINVATCPFKINGLSVTGGPMAFDPATNFLYLTDEQTNSLGIFRIGYLPTGDNGQGSLDFNNVFAMVGAITGSRFSGGTTGCAFPNDDVGTVIVNGVKQAAQTQSVPLGVPDGLALGPDGNLWIGFKKQGAIIRINNPATATAAGFGTCNDFVQLVAEGPDPGGGNGIAFIGHDLWGADEAGPFVIKNADIACQALGATYPQTPTCGDASPATATFAALTPTAIYSDQTYPYLNGNNLYFADTVDDMWVGNVSGDATSAAIVKNPFEPVNAFNPNGAAANVGINAVVADSTDPANIVLYSGDDPSLAAILALGRWWTVFQNPPARAAKPNVVTVVRASAVGNTITVSWSPAQTGVPVTSYTVRASTGALADHTVTPALGGTFPPNFLVIPGVANGTYAFKIIANNAQGNNGLSTASNTVKIPTVVPPSIPTNVSATAGDTVAFVSFVAPPNSATQNITSYTITSSPGGVTKTVGAAATTGTVTGLINGTTYTFTVHANNAATTPGMESTPSNAVTPIAAQVPVTLALNGPLTVSSVPIMSTFTATLTNTTPNLATGLTLTYNLTTTDGAAVLIGQPGSGTCTTTSSILVNCNLGSLAAGASVNVNFLVQIQTNSISATATFNGTATPAGGAATAVTSTTPVLNTTTPGAPPQGGNGPTLTVTVTASSAKPTLNTNTGTTHTFVATNTGSILATNLSMLITEPGQLTITGVTASSTAPADPVTCNPAIVTPGQPTTILCNIASLGGNLKNGNKPNTAQTITIQVNVQSTATTFTLPVSATVAFDGIDAVSPTATFTQTVK
jgi:hypothetical protein